MPAVDDPAHSQLVVQREAILRSTIADFGGVIVDQRKMADYSRNSKGELKKESCWRVIVDVLGEDHDQKMRILYSKLKTTFGASGVQIIRYPVEKIMN